MILQFLTETVSIRLVPQSHLLDFGRCSVSHHHRPQRFEHRLEFARLVAEVSEYVGIDRRGADFAASGVELDAVIDEAGNYRADEINRSGYALVPIESPR
jgi:hypothetical protein